MGKYSPTYSSSAEVTKFLVKEFAQFVLKCPLGQQGNTVPVLIMLKYFLSSVLLSCIGDVELHAFQILTLNESKLPASRAGSFTPRYKLDRRLGGPHSHSVYSGGYRTIFVTENRRLAILPVASNFTELFHIGE